MAISLLVITAELSNLIILVVPFLSTNISLVYFPTLMEFKSEFSLRFDSIERNEFLCRMYNL